MSQTALSRAPAAMGSHLEEEETPLSYPNTSFNKVSTYMWNFVHPVWIFERISLCPIVLLKSLSVQLKHLKHRRWRQHINTNEFQLYKNNDETAMKHCYQERGERGTPSSPDKAGHASLTQSHCSPTNTKQAQMFAETFKDSLQWTKPPFTHL